MTTLKTRIKTGVRDALRGFLLARPDVYLFIGVVYMVSVSAVILVLSEHGNPTPEDARVISDGLTALFFLIVGAPVAIGVMGAISRAVLRRTRWADKALWDSERYVTVEEHERKMAAWDDRREAEVREQVEAELQARSDGGGDE